MAARSVRPQWAALLLVAALALATCARAAEFGGAGEAYDWEEDDYVSEAPSPTLTASPPGGSGRRRADVRSRARCPPAAQEYDYETAEPFDGDYEGYE